MRTKNATFLADLPNQNFWNFGFEKLLVPRCEHKLLRSRPYDLSSTGKLERFSNEQQFNWEKNNLDVNGIQHIECHSHTTVKRIGIG